MRNGLLVLMCMVAAFSSCCKEKPSPHPSTLCIYELDGRYKSCYNEGKDDSFFVVIGGTAYLKLKMTFLDDTGNDIALFNIGIVIDSTVFNSLSGELFIGDSVPNSHSGLYKVTSEIVCRGNTYILESGDIQFGRKQSRIEEGTSVCEWSFDELYINFKARNKETGIVRRFSVARLFFLDR